MTAPPRQPAPRESGQPEDARLDRVAALSGRAAAQAGLIVTGQDWAAWLNLAARLRGWSFTNLMLIAAQCPTATMVAGYEEWQARGRHVRKGEPGMTVIAEPHASSAVAPDARRQTRPEIPERKRQPGRLARASYVWDITQTSGPASTVPEAPLPAAAGTPPGLRDALTWLARREGFAVDLRDSVPGPGVTSWGSHRIRIRPGLGVPEEAWALIHELGHVLAHDSLALVPEATTAGCGGIRKIEADSIAFIIMARLGIHTPARVWPSVASWAGSDPRAHPSEAIRVAGTRITAAAAAITAHLGSALFAGPQPGAAIRPAASPRAASGINADERSSTARTPSRPATAYIETGATTTAGHVGDDLRRILADTARFYLRRLDNSWVPGYLQGRGFTQAVMTRWRVGYAPAGWTVLLDHLRARGHDDAAIEAAGLASRSARGTYIDHFRDRVMVPIRDEHGAVVGFTGRARPDAGAAVPKYLNSPTTALYTKGDLLFGLYEARSQLSRGAVPVIAEGPFDAIAISMASPGRHAGLAPCGTALTSRQAESLGRAADLSGTGVLVALDGDRAGREAAIRAYRILLPVTARAVAVMLPPGSDPAQMLQAGGPAALAGLLQNQVQPLARVVIDAHLDSWASQLDHPEGQLRALRSAAAVIADLLPAPTGDRVLEITGGRILAALDENLRPVADAQLPVIARLLPAGAACQIALVADRLDSEYSDITVEVVNALTRDRTARGRRLAAGPLDQPDGRHNCKPDEDAADRTRPGFPDLTARCGKPTGTTTRPRMTPTGQHVSGTQRRTR